MAINTSIFGTILVSSLLWTSTYRNFVTPFALLASTQINIRRKSHFCGHRNQSFSCKSSVAASIDVNSDATSTTSIGWMTCRRPLRIPIFIRDFPRSCVCFYKRWTTETRSSTCFGIMIGNFYYFLQYVYTRMTCRRPQRIPIFIRDFLEVVYVFVRDGELRHDPPPAL